MLSQEQINAIKEREAKATPGPWHQMFKVGIEIHAENEWAPVIEEDVGVVRYPDADFIIAAREDIPQLVAEVERLGEVAVARYHLNKSWERIADEKEAEIKRLKYAITYACEMMSIGESGKANDKLTEVLGVPYDYFEEEFE